MQTVGCMLFVEENCSSEWGIWENHSLIHLSWITSYSPLTTLHWPKELNLLIMNLAWSSPQVLGWHKTNDDVQPCVWLASSSKIWSNTKEKWSMHKLLRRDKVASQVGCKLAEQWSPYPPYMSEAIASRSVPLPTSTLVQDASSQYQLTFKPLFSHTLGVVGRATYLRKGLLALQAILHSSRGKSLAGRYAAQKARGQSSLGGNGLCRVWYRIRQHMVVFGKETVSTPQSFNLIHQGPWDPPKLATAPKKA